MKRKGFPFGLKIPFQRNECSSYLRISEENLYAIEAQRVTG